jgi:hypothetical protein
MGTRRLKGAVGGWGDTPAVKHLTAAFLSAKHKTEEVIQFRYSYLFSKKLLETLFNTLHAGADITASFYAATQ